MYLRSMRLLLFTLIVFCCSSCSSNNQKSETSREANIPLMEPVMLANCLQLESRKNRQVHERIFSRFGLVDVQKVEPKIQINLKYSSDDNFMHLKLYEQLDRIYLQEDVAKRLKLVQQQLDSIKSGYHLLVFDGVRPVNVQQKMWNALDSIPVLRRSRFVSNPANKSLHNYGAAIDLTIVDAEGKELDMGAGYDDNRLIAYPSYEAHFVSIGELTNEQLQNRLLLRKVMRSQEFRQLPSEWWHYNACSRWEAAAKYKILEKEPIVTN